jgi:hypothetical protein
MPLFEVTVTTVYEFEAKDRDEARWMVENGEMPVTMMC